MQEMSRQQPYCLRLVDNNVAVHGLVDDGGGRRRVGVLCRMGSSVMDGRSGV
jgi:hypothetical protein